MTKIDPYEVLGIDRTADKKTIRSAYRKRAKKMHPDTGGSKRQFGSLQLAHDVLSDDTRRAKYDATGDIEEKTIDNAYSQAVNALAMAFNSVLQECAQEGVSPIECDLLLRTQQELKYMLSEKEKELRITRSMLEVDLKLRGRFKVAAGKENVLAYVVDARITSMRSSLEKAERDSVAAKKALEFTEGVVFEYDHTEEFLSPGDRMMRRLGAYSV